MSTATKLAAISQWIDDSYPLDLDREAHLWRRITKAGTEYGETLDAFAGAIGENPRKGITNDMGDVLEELLDIAVAALGAVEHLNSNDGSAMALLALKVAKVYDRAGLSS